MERYVYNLIIIFSSIIFILYIYLLYKKICDLYYLNKKEIYSKEITPYIDSLIVDLDKNDIIDTDRIKLAKMSSNKIQRNILSDRLMYFLDIFTGTVRDKIVQLCENIGLVDYEILNLKSNNHYKIALSCKRLGEYRSQKAIQPIISVLKKNNTDIKYHGLMALAKIGDTYSFVTAIEGLKRRLLLSERCLTEIVDSFEGDKLLLYRKMIRSTSSYISTIFIKSAGNYMDTSLSEDIEFFLEDYHKDRKIAAIKSIGQIGDTRYVDKIISALKDNDWEIRAVAAKSLGRLSSETALVPLINALSDREWWVRYNSAWSIIQIPGGEDVIESVLTGNDRFAKEILISTIENSRIIDNIFIYEDSPEAPKRRLAYSLKKYITNKEIVR